MPEENHPPDPEGIPEQPTILGGIAPDDLIVRGMLSVKMTGIGSGGTWQPPTVEEAARFFPDYEVIKLLGRGGMGAVYQARQIELDRLVAIKLLPLEISIDQEFAARFRREARAMARLHHPNIVTVHDFGKSREGHLYFVMEYVEGANLAELIRTAQLSSQQALHLVEQVCTALAYAHGKGIVHRDIKPANVMIDTESHVRVADFGLARLNDPNGEQSTHTTTDTVMGTPDYMAPEQMKDMNVDHRADIYSLGVMLYVMLCRELPKGIFQPPSRRIPGLDGRVDRIVIRAMQQDPSLRYQSTHEMKADVRSVRTGAGALLPAFPVRSAHRPPAAVWKPEVRKTPGSPPNVLPVRNPGAAPVAPPPPKTPDLEPTTPLSPAETHVPPAAPFPRASATSRPRPAPRAQGEDPVPLLFLGQVKTFFLEMAGLRLVRTWTGAVAAVAVLVFVIAHFSGSGASPAPRAPAVPTASGKAPEPEKSAPTPAPAVAAQAAPPPPPAAATPSPAMAHERPDTQEYAEDLLVQGVQLRENGDLSGAIAKFVEARAINPKNPQLLAELGVTCEKAGRTGEAKECWQQIAELGSAAGAYYALAEVRLTALPAVQGLASGATLGLLPVLVEDQQDKDSARHFTLHIPVRARPGVSVNPSRLVIQVLCYDLIDHKDIVPTTARVTTRWARPHPDWSIADTEELRVEYQLPKPPAGAPQSVDYFGYLVRAYYEQQLQASTGEPARLAQQYPPPSTFSPAPAPGQPSKPLVGNQPAKLAAAAGPGTLAEILISPDYEWSKPENLGPGVNGTKDDYALGMTRDGLDIIISSTRMGARHLLECRRKSVDEPFGPAILIKELAASGYGSAPSLSADGLTLVYASHRDRSKSDLYEAHRRYRESSWEKPRRIVLPGGAFHDGGPCLSDDGLTLWFNSDRPGGIGGLNIWRADRPSLAAPFAAPSILGPTINSAIDDLSPRVTADNRAILFYREDHGAGQQLFLALMDEKGAYSTQPLVLPFPGNVQSPVLSADGRTLYFASDMPGGRGEWDLWQIRRVPKSKASAANAAAAPRP